MRVAFVTGSVSRSAGGMFYSVRRLAQSLSEEGVTVAVFGLADQHTSEDIRLWAPVEVHASRVLGPAGFAPGLVRRVASFGPDLVHVHGMWMYPSGAAGQWARRHHLPYAVSPRGMLEPWAWEYHAWRKRPVWHLWEKGNLRSAIALHATAESEAVSLRLRELANPIAVVPNGIDLPELVEAAPRNRTWRRVLFLSRIHPKKGLPDLVEAWRCLKPEGWRVTVAGTDEDGHLKEVMGLVAKAGLQNCFEFVGPLHGSQKWKMYHSSDIFVLPTRSENFGLVVAEALASGVPVITTRAAPWECLTSQQCGWWIEGGVEPLVQALRAAMALSDQERSAMGGRGRKLVGRELSWCKAAAEMKSVYEWILGGGKRPDCVITK